MLVKLSTYIARWISSHTCIPAEEFPVYVYGAETALYSLFSTLGLVAIGCFFHLCLESIIVISVYYLNQTVGGGFHASSHIKCFSLMSVGLCISLSIYRFFSLSSNMYIIICSVSLLLLFSFPLILHPNKAYLAPKTPQLKHRSRLMVIMQTIFAIVLPILNSKVGYCFSLGLCVSALSRIVGIRVTPRNKTS